MIPEYCENDKNALILDNLALLREEKIAKHVSTYNVESSSFDTLRWHPEWRVHEEALTCRDSVDQLHELIQRLPKQEGNALTYALCRRGLAARLQRLRPGLCRSSR
jgi:hypothetical protein